MTTTDFPTNEQWRDVVGYEGIYQVSDQGRVKTVLNSKHAKFGRVLKTTVTKAGYVSLGLYKEKKLKTTLLHRVVAAAFINVSTQEVNHIDGNKLNNCASNLEYVTHARNLQHASQNGLLSCGERNGMTTLTYEQVEEIRNRYKQGGVTHRSLALEYAVDPTTIGNIVNNHTWKNTARPTPESGAR